MLSMGVSYFNSFLYGSCSDYLNEVSMVKIKILQTELLKTSIGGHKLCKGFLIFKTQNIGKI